MVKSLQKKKKSLEEIKLEQTNLQDEEDEEPVFTITNDDIDVTNEVIDINNAFVNKIDEKEIAKLQKKIKRAEKTIEKDKKRLNELLSIHGLVG